MSDLCNQALLQFLAIKLDAKFRLPVNCFSPSDIGPHSTVRPGREHHPDAEPKPVVSIRTNALLGEKQYKSINEACLKSTKSTVVVCDELSSDCYRLCLSFTDSGRKFRELNISRITEEGHVPSVGWSVQDPWSW